MENISFCMSEEPFQRFQFALFENGYTWEFSEIALKQFCSQTNLQVYFCSVLNKIVQVLSIGGSKVTGMSREKRENEKWSVLLVWLICLKSKINC